MDGTLKRSFGILVIVFSCIAMPVLAIAAGDIADYPDGQNQEYREGPHKQFACIQCHKEDKGQKPSGADSVNENSIDLCMGCHPVEHLHPVGVSYNQQSKIEARTLPLGKGQLTGKIVCFTCHAIHRKIEIPYLLRGSDTGYRLVRTSLCQNCHQEIFFQKSPHPVQEGKCIFCHIVQPDEKTPASRKHQLIYQLSCGLCHTGLSAQHYEGMNPFVDSVIQHQAEQDDILTVRGRPVCTSCHEPHEKAKQKYLLDDKYLALCFESRSVNPHWNDLLCRSCHSDIPVPGNSPLREDGNYSKICNRCHHSEYARAEIHPVGIASSEHTRIPEELPLHGNRLSCVTCHNALVQMGSSEQKDVEASNPNFLRQNSMSRNSFCFLCHVEETYKRLNPHKQLDENGVISEETCLFCHASIPDVRFIGPEKVSFIVQDPNEYCIGCHHGFAKYHPAGVMHLIKPSEKIMAAIRTSVQRIGVELPLYKGQIVCATCHNPHETGVIKVAAAATGTQRENKLRLKPGRKQCTGCHWDK